MSLMFGSEKPRAHHLALNDPSVFCFSTQVPVIGREEASCFGTRDQTFLSSICCASADIAWYQEFLSGPDRAEEAVIVSVVIAEIVGSNGNSVGIAVKSSAE